MRNLKDPLHMGPIVLRVDSGLGVVVGVVVVVVVVTVVVVAIVVVVGAVVGDVENTMALGLSTFFWASISDLIQDRKFWTRT